MTGRKAVIPLLRHPSVLFVLLLLVASSRGPAAASSEVFEGSRPVQVAYSVDIVEIREDELFEFGLSIPPGSAPGSNGAATWQLWSREELPERAGTTLDMWWFQTATAHSSSRRVANPRIVTTFRRPGAVRVAQQEVYVAADSGRLVTTDDGIELQITPLRDDPETGDVLSIVTVRSLSEPTSIETELWVGAGAPRLVAVLASDSWTQGKGLFSRGVRTDRRYYAVYAVARATSGSVGPGPAAVARLRGLNEWLWPEGPRWWVRPSYADFAARVDGGFGLDYETAVQFSGEGSQMRFAAGRLFGIRHYRFVWQGVVASYAESALMLGVHLDEKWSGVYFTEEIRLAPGLHAAAGYAPVVYRRREKSWGSPVWWAYIALGEKSVVRLDYRSAGTPTWEATWLQPIGRDWFFRATRRLGHDGQSGGWLFGLRVEFGR